MTLRLFKDVAFTFVEGKHYKYAMLQFWIQSYETQMHGTTHTKTRKWDI